MKLSIQSIAFLLVGVLTLAFTGCTTVERGDTGPTAFLRFEGEQKRWPHSKNALVKEGFSLPVYLGPPSRSYRILGIVVDDEPSVLGKSLPRWVWPATDDVRLGVACNQARLQGADAVMISNDPVILRPLGITDAGDSKSASPLYNFDGAVVAIKWE